MIPSCTSLLICRPLRSSSSRCQQQGLTTIRRSCASKSSPRRPRNKRNNEPLKPTAKMQEPTLFQPFVWYSHKLDTHPILTKAVSSGLVSGCGDILGQSIAYKQGECKVWSWDALRTGRFVVLGTCLVAPVTHVWYALVNRQFPGGSASAVAKRVFFDQACFAPLFLPTWLASLWTLEGRDSHFIMSKMQTQIPPTLLANWSLWIPAMTVNFTFVPGKFQVLFSNLVAVAWNTYLSFSTHHPEEEGEQ